MRRRDLLRILCGLPLVLGLPRLARADGDPPAEPTPGDALSRARARGRPVLLVAVPVDADPTKQYGRRQRLARRLDELLSAKDEATRLLVANLVVVVAREADLRAAVPGLAPARDAKLAPAGSVVWLVSGERTEQAPGALDGEDEPAARLVERVRAVVLPGPDGLAPRRDLELRALGAERAAVERDLAGLGAASESEREQASTRLAGRADALVATLTLLVAAPRTDDEVRARAQDLVLRIASAAVPLGMRWGEFTPGCGVEEPYEEEPSMVDCGMAKVTRESRRFLYLVAPG